MESKILIEKLARNKIWDDQPVFCFTSDIDWASEAILRLFLNYIDPMDLKPTMFLTHRSTILNNSFVTFDKGIHPNFLPGSSHGESFKEVIKYCESLCPGSLATRSHRSFDVTDTSHLLYANGYRYSSNWVTQMTSRMRPILHESGLINIPIFWEDGTHLYNKMNLKMEHYWEHLKTPGIKVISIHPTNFVLNPPTLEYMRNIKDSLSRWEYNNMNQETIAKFRNTLRGIADATHELISYVKATNSKIMSLKEIYNECIAD